MAKRRRQAGPDPRQFDLFAMAPQAAAPVLPTPTPATTTQLPTPPPPPTTAAALTQPQPIAHLVDGDRKHRIARRSAVELAELAVEAWYSGHVGDDIAIPMGVVAGLTQLRKTATDGTDTASFILGLDKRALLKFHQHIWSHLWIRHPYLVEMSRPIHEWLNQEKGPPAKVIDAVHTVTHAAIRNGLFHIAGDPDPAMRSDTDLLGTMLTRMRSEGKRAALAEIHTPPEVADLMASVLFRPDGMQPGQWIDDPAAGTGGLLRAAALAMRMRGMNPHEFGWSMTEIDPIAAACAAVNALVWGLGRNVLIYVGDTLTTGDAASRAYKHRKAVEAHHERVMEASISAANWMVAIRKVQTLIGKVEESPSTPGRPGRGGHLGAAAQTHVAST
ncbi:N-6 DNA methylase [Nonomuraea angiospora]|uniref:N-6 DNA methylase n=1 Tax=Nonomuraea angiospora TaxID=46172 RepID=UPI0029A0B1CD|nr:N-6 DNA methylase [Nonomuraea angiospora]MDX3100489.1 N-6 DNA methylase [Nonomuraea angiospora]